MSKIARNTQHHINEPIELLEQILQRMLKDAQENAQGKFSKEKMQRFNRLCFIFKNFLEQTKIKKQNLSAEYEFLESASLLVDQIVLARDEVAFITKANATDPELLKKLATLVTELYAVVYSNKLVQGAVGEMPHVSSQFATVIDKVAGQKLVDEIWTKVHKAELVSDEADKKLSVVVKKIQELHDMQATQIPDNLHTDFRKVSTDAYLLGAASTLALEELAEAKAHLAKLIAQG